MEIDFYKEQLQSKEDMLASTTRFLLETKRELEIANEKLSEINNDVFNSIKFAELIQTSLLPDIEFLKIFTKDACYKVKQQINIGGDTVFVKKTNWGILFGLLDSTGHGIPAAMLSIGSLLMLNNLTSSMQLESPNALMKLLNSQLNNTFNNNLSIAHMEGSIFFYSSKLHKLTYSSANGKALYVTCAGEITELQRTKNSIGENQLSEFDNYEIDFKEGDKLLLYSDGLIDQFGGKEDKKFSRLRLKQLIKNEYKKNVTEISDIIFAEHSTWKGDKQQTDDLSFMIIEF